MSAERESRIRLAAKGEWKLDERFAIVSLLVELDATRAKHAEDLEHAEIAFENMVESLGCQ